MAHPLPSHLPTGKGLEREFEDSRQAHPNFVYPSLPYKQHPLSSGLGKKTTWGLEADPGSPGKESGGLLVGARSLF